MRPRLKVMAAMLAVSFGMQNAAWAARYIDTSGNWTERYINRMSDNGVLPAEPDGKIKPDEPVTRAQLSVWLAKTLHIDSQPVPPTSSFPDVQTTDPFYKAVEQVRQNNLIAGYPDGFRPNQYIQRAEVMTIISRALKETKPDDATISAELAKYADASKIPDWARVGIAEDSMAGIIVNDKDPDKLNPTDIAKRGETIALLSKLDEYVVKQQAANPQPPATPPATTAAAPPQTAPAQGAYPPPGYGYPPPSQPYAGNVAKQGYAPPAPPPAPSAPPPAPYNGAAQGAYAPPYQAGYPAQAPPNYLQGAVQTVSAGTKFQAALVNTLDSGSTQPGEQVTATIGSPMYQNGVEIVPAGSRIIGSVTSVQSAKRFHAGENGKIDIKFTSIETPDGRRIPLSASVDSNQVHLTGGTTAGRIGKGALTTGIGAASGAALGTALGAIVGGTAGGPVGRSTGMGAVFGTALGGGVGLVGAVVRKGSEVKLTAGMNIPIQLDQNMQVTAAAPPGYPPAGYPPPQGYGYAAPQGYPPPPQGYQPPPQYGSGAPPVQQPSGYYPPQQ